MLKQTPLHAVHVASGAKMVDFGGWDMPLHYGSQIEEHHAVRRKAGMFDVSHMRVVDLDGAASREFLRTLIANDVAKLVPGKALYSCMLTEKGTVIDDLIVYWMGADHYRLVVNAATADKDIAWMRRVENVSVPVACSPPRDWMASRALTARLITTCSSCRGSARTGPSSRSWWVRSVMRTPSSRLSICPTSLITSGT